MSIYYVYAYLRKKDLTPYYIGKGKDRRAYCKDHSVVVPKDRSRVVFLERNLTEIGAFALERRYIQWYGRRDLGTGILRNCTDGGDGSAGVIPWNKGKPQSESHRAALAESRKRSGKSSPMLGRTHSEETRRRLSEINKGKPKSDETRRKLSEAATGKPKPPRSDEHRRKLSEAARLRNNKRP